MIKLIATDMDGTWLTSQKTYDESLFLQDLAVMKAKGVRFVIASGNQYENIHSRFGDKADDLFFIAENGALAAKGRQIMSLSALDSEQTEILKRLARDYPYPAVLSGFKTAYVREKDGVAYFKDLKKYFAKLIQVPSFDDVHDRLFKMSFSLDADQLAPLQQDLQSRYPQLAFVAGSTESLDMQPRGMNKAYGLKLLGRKLGIEPSEMVAFGDSGNDVEMLRYAGMSFVTADAMPEAKAAADQVIGSSEDSSVQYKILELLKK